MQLVNATQQARLVTEVLSIINVTTLTFFVLLVPARLYIRKGYPSGQSQIAGLGKAIVSQAAVEIMKANVVIELCVN